MSDLTSGFLPNGDSFVPPEQTPPLGAERELASKEAAAVEVAAKELSENAEQSLRAWANGDSSLQEVQRQVSSINGRAGQLETQLDGIRHSLPSDDEQLVRLPEMTRLRGLQRQLTAASEIVNFEKAVGVELGLLAQVNADLSLVDGIKDDLQTTIEGLLENNLNIPAVVTTALEVLPEDIRRPVEERLNEMKETLEETVKEMSPDDSVLGLKKSNGRAPESAPPSAASVAGQRGASDIEFDSAVWADVTDLDIPGSWSFNKVSDAVKQLHTEFVHSLANAKTVEEAIQIAQEGHAVYNEVTTYFDVVAQTDPALGDRIRVAWAQTPLGSPRAELAPDATLGDYVRLAIYNGVLDGIQFGALGALATYFAADSSKPPGKAMLLAKSIGANENMPQAYPHFVLLLLSGPANSKEVNGKDVLLQKAAIHDVYVALERMYANSGWLLSISEIEGLSTVMSSQEQDVAFAGLPEAHKRLEGLMSKLKQALPEDIAQQLVALHGVPGGEAEAMRQKIFLEHIDLKQAISILGSNIQSDIKAVFSYLGGVQKVLAVLERAHNHPNTLALTKGSAKQLHAEIAAMSGVKGSTVFAQASTLASDLNRSTVGLGQGLHDLIANMSPSPEKDALFQAYAFVISQS